MKRTVSLLFFIIVIMNSLPAQEIFPNQEMQISFGPEFALSAFKINNDYAFRDGTLAYLINENTSSVYFAPGMNFSMRLFRDTDMLISKGFFFRGRTIFITSMKTRGTASIGDYTFRVSETYSISDKDFFAGIMDFDLGQSTRFKISERLQLYTDLGLNFTIMDIDYDKINTLNYWGAGVFADLAMQVNLTKTMFLEFGLNSLFNVFSSQKGTVYTEDFGYKTISYEDSGRWDLSSVSVYINIGWRINLKNLEKKMYNQQNTKTAPETAVSD
jgi:hypothetical protein